MKAFCDQPMLNLYWTFSKFNFLGLSAKRIELAERKMERHRRRESEFSAIEKRREARKARIKLKDVREVGPVAQIVPLFKSHSDEIILP